MLLFSSSLQFIYILQFLCCIFCDVTGRYSRHADVTRTRSSDHRDKSQAVTVTKPDRHSMVEAARHSVMGSPDARTWSSGDLNIVDDWTDNIRHETLVDTEPIFVPGRLLGTSCLLDDRDETRIDEELMSSATSDDDDDDGAFSDVTPSHDALHGAEVTSSGAGSGAPFVRETRCRLRRQHRRSRLRPRGPPRVVDDMSEDTSQRSYSEQLTSTEQSEYSSV